MGGSSAGAALILSRVGGTWTSLVVGDSAPKEIATSARCATRAPDETAIYIYHHDDANFQRSFRNFWLHDSWRTSGMPLCATLVCPKVAADQLVCSVTRG